MPQVDTDDLSIAYGDTGPRDGPALLMLHGWPDDASTWDGVAPALNDAGFRTIVPMLRGFGETRLRTATVPRTANPGILAMDAIALLDALGIETFAAIGHDWGSNICEALAVGWPQRVGRLAMLSTPPRLGGMKTPPFWHAQREWYHWFMATARGAQAVRDDPKELAYIHWVNWSPKGWFDEATFDRVSRSWDNPDWVDVTLHSYRSRWGEAEPDPKSAWLEDKVKSTETLSLPARYIHGCEDGVNPPTTAESVPEKFDGPFEIIAIEGVGHFPQREAPDRVTRELLALLRDA